MALLSLRDVAFGFVSPPLLEHAELQIEHGERVGLLGRNGSGKSTLMKLMLGELPPDSGQVERQAGLRIARLVQDVPVGRTGTIFDEVAAGLGDAGDAVAAAYRLHHPDASLTGAERESLSSRTQTLNPETAWRLEHAVEVTLDKMQLDPFAPF